MYSDFKNSCASAFLFAEIIQTTACHPTMTHKIHKDLPDNQVKSIKI